MSPVTPGTTDTTIYSADASENSESKEGTMPGGQSVVLENTPDNSPNANLWCCCRSIAALFASCVGCCALRKTND